MKRALHRFKKNLKDFELASLLALVHSILSNFCSAFFFEPNTDDPVTKRNILLINILLPLFLFFIYWGLIKLVKNHKKYRPFIRCGIFYFVILMILLFLVWPGVWRHDDMTVAICAKQYIIDGWQHSLTSLFYMLSFRLIPIYSGVIVIQCVFIAIITSYLYNELSNQLKLKKLFPKILLWIPFFLPPILDNALYSLRPILFSYILVLAIYLMIKYLSYKQISWQKLSILMALFVIGCVWRSEGLYLLIVAPVYLIYITKKHKISIRYTIFSILTLFISFFIVSSFQNSILSGHDQARYQLSGTVHVAAPLIRQAAAEGDAQTLADIDKVISVKTFIEHPNWSGETVFWSEGAVRDDFSQEDYQAYLKTLINLCLRYPSIAIKNRINNFLITSALRDDFSNTIKDTTGYYEGSSDVTDLAFVETGGRFMHQWNPKLRNAIIRILEGRNIHNYGDTIITYPIFWNLIIPFISIIISVVYLLYKRKVAIALIIAPIFIKSLIVFATAPGVYHMYYHSEYLLGYILIFFMILYILSQHQIKNPKRSKV